MTTRDPRAILGVDPGADVATVRAAYRALSLKHHPDVGGDPAMMALINEAYRSLASDRVAARANSAPAHSGRRVERDVPSFTVDALPVEAFELLLLAAAILGDVADEDPPYMLEFVVRGGEGTWCRCDLVPDAGSTTVSVTTTTQGDSVPLGVETLRDLLVAEINDLAADTGA